MSQTHAEATAVIDARPEEIYAVLSDYRQGHPAILPKRFFTELVVEKGGTGAGTIIKVRMNVLGVERVYQMTVSEPEPGRVLVEADTQAGVVTTFTVDSLEGGKRSRVTIATAARTSPGFQGLVERAINPTITRRIYREQLQRLSEFVAAIEGPDG
jgi:hypothetical protein